jgi:competence protein ComEC
MAALAWMAGLLIGRSSSAWEFAAAGAAAAALGIGLSWRTPALRRALVLALTLCLGACLGWRTWHPALPEERLWHVTAVVVDEVRDGSREQQHRTILGSVTLDGEPWRGKAYWSFYAEELPEGLEPGMGIEADLRLYHPSGAENPGGFDFREYLLQQGISIGLFGMENLRVVSAPANLTGGMAALRHRLLLRLRETMGDDAGDLAATVLLGLRSALPTEDRDAFSRLGIAHVLSVSGFHVGVLWAALTALERRMRLPRAARLGVSGTVIGLYALMTGLGAPVIRAAVLLLLREIAVLRRRPAEPLHLLSAAALITLAWMPAQLTGASFQLSYGAMLGLVLVLPHLMRLSERVPQRPLRRALQALALTGALQLGVLLPQLYWFRQLPVLGWVLNTVVMGAAGVFLTLMWVLLAILWIPGIGPLAGRAMAGLSGLITGGVRAMSEQSWVTLWTPQAGWITALGWLLAVLGLCGLVRLGARRRWALLGCSLVVMALSLVPWPHRGVTWTQLSVGTADAAVLQDDDTVWLIDAGDDSTAATWLHQRRLPVDTLVITHLHQDHFGGVEELLRQRIPIRRVVLADGADRPALHESMLELLQRLRESGVEILWVSRGDRLPLPHGEAAVLWPVRDWTRLEGDANDSSMALLVQLHGTRILTCGDLTLPAEPYCQADADIVKLSHHGSATSNGPEWLEAASPLAYLLSGSSADRTQAWRERLGDVPLWSTERCGAVTIRIAENGFEISGFLPEGE